MSVRVLLVALLFWGSVGSTVCGTLCARSGADTQPSLGEPVAAVPPCHAGRAAEPQSAPWNGDSSGALCCCPDEELAATFAVATGDESSRVSMAGGPVSLRVRPEPNFRRIGARPPDLGNFPYRTENPPLLS